MANEIFTRIQLKYDSYTEWQKVEATFKPLKGEICIVNPATNLADAAKVPCLMKVGDGTNFFKDLPWISATAADVYKWAKAADVVFENQHIIFKDATGASVKDLNLSDFVTADELATELENYVKEDGFEAKVHGAVGTYKIVNTALNLNDTIDNIVGDILMGDIAVDTAKKTEHKASFVIGGEDVDFDGSADVTVDVDGAITTKLGDYYNKLEADAAFTTPEEVESIIDTALAEVSGTDAIEGITTLVQYVNEHGADLAAITKEIYGDSGKVGDDPSRIDTAITDSAQAKTDAAAAVSTANGANATAGEAKTLAQEAKEAATNATTGAAASASAAAASAAEALASEGAAAQSASQAALSEGAANDAKTAAEAAKDAAVNAKTAAETAKSNAEIAEGNAIDAKDAAVAAQGAAEGARDAAVTAKGAAESAKTAAETAQSKAETAQDEAEKAQVAAEAAKSAAATSEANAKTSETNAGNSATAAAGSASAAAQSAENADASADAALESKNAAAQSALTAEQQASTATQKANAAAGSATTATEKAAAAAQSATDANAAKEAAVAAKEAAEASNTSATAIANQAKTTADGAKEAADAATEAVAGLHAIATSGSIYDVAEGSNTTATGAVKYLVFNCGTASTLID